MKYKVIYRSNVLDKGLSLKEAKAMRNKKDEELREDWFAKCPTYDLPKSEIKLDR